MSIASEIQNLQRLCTRLQTKLNSLLETDLPTGFLPCTQAVEGIVKQEAVRQRLDTVTQSVTIPAGYHNGQGTVELQTADLHLTTNGTYTAPPGNVIAQVTVQVPTVGGFPASPTAGDTPVLADFTVESVTGKASQTLQHRLTVPRTGGYRFRIPCVLSTGNGGVIALLKNGEEVQSASIDSTDVLSAPITFDVACMRGDVITLVGSSRNSLRILTVMGLIACIQWDPLS